ncbi:MULTISPECIES: protease inhibitor I42 family protein [Streptomyces]|uniref:Protease inhibitor I42 family protein n=1 Tax=Streptomyces eurythermus TaxID=42237 RepID=A0ABW6YU92_9ACTN|nr:MULTISPECIES: protease inhibitor I42 family protein [Streptomyces]QIS71643.1 protease inhibitor I42 family protein [Streptomyces sp. DSM 40868]
MTSRTTRLAPAALLALLALTGCGTDGGTTGAPAPTVGSTSTLRATPGGGTEYGIERRDITVRPGERFSLTVPSAPTLGEHWYLADPRPDKAVLASRGEHTTGDNREADGSTGSTRSFDFTALAEGRTRVRLLHCPLHTCTGPGPGDRSTLGPSPGGSPSPYPTLTADPHAHGTGAGFYVFTITVR